MKFQLGVVLIICTQISVNRTWPVKISKHPVVILVSYDGFGQEIFSTSTFPYLDRVKEHGVSIEYLQSQFPTYTAPNHMSIVTGLYLESHGVLANSIYDPKYGKVLHAWNKDEGFWNNTSTLLPLWVSHISCSPVCQVIGLCSLQTVNELAGDGRASGVMMWPGVEQPYGIDQKTLPTYYKFFNGSTNFEERIDVALSWLTDEQKPANLILLYFEQPDLTGHTKGMASSEFHNAVRQIDDTTGYLLHKLQLLGVQDQVNVIFLSDHGLVQMKPQNQIPYSEILRAQNDPKFAVYEINSMLQILPKESKDTLKIYKAFKEASKSMHFQVYLKEEINESNPLWHFKHNARALPIIAFAEFGYYFVSHKDPNTHPFSMHGFDNNAPEMRAFFRALGPNLKKGFVAPIFENVDVFPLSCHLLNVTAPPNNGSLLHTQSLLKT